MSNATVTSRTRLVHIRLPKALVEWIEKMPPHPQGFSGHVVAVLQAAKEPLCRWVVVWPRACRE